MKTGPIFQIGPVLNSHYTNKKFDLPLATVMENGSIAPPFSTSK
jgi:hypothetical protein